MIKHVAKKILDFWFSGHEIWTIMNKYEHLMIFRSFLRASIASRWLGPGLVGAKEQGGARLFFRARGSHLQLQPWHGSQTAAGMERGQPRPGVWAEFQVDSLGGLLYHD